MLISYQFLFQYLKDELHDILLGLVYQECFIKLIIKRWNTMGIRVWDQIWNIVLMENIPFGK